MISGDLSINLTAHNPKERTKTTKSVRSFCLLNIEVYNMRKIKKVTYKYSIESNFQLMAINISWLNYPKYILGFVGKSHLFYIYFEK